MVIVKVEFVVIVYRFVYEMVLLWILSKLFFENGLGKGGMDRLMGKDCYL